jgi:hypothetical protein
VKSEFPTAVLILYFSAMSSGIYMSLNNVAIQSAIHEHAALQIDLCAYLPRTQIRFLKRFLNGGNGIVRSFDLHDRQAASVVGNTLIDLQFMRERGFDRKMLVCTFGLNGFNNPNLFNDSGKHQCKVKECN